MWITCKCVYIRVRRCRELGRRLVVALYNISWRVGTRFVADLLPFVAFTGPHGPFVFRSGTAGGCGRLQESPPPALTWSGISPVPPPPRPGPVSCLLPDHGTSDLDCLSVPTDANEHPYLSSRPLPRLPCFCGLRVPSVPVSPPLNGCMPLAAGDLRWSPATGSAHSRRVRTALVVCCTTKQCPKSKIFASVSSPEKTLRVERLEQMYAMNLIFLENRGDFGVTVVAACYGGW